MYSQAEERQQVANQALSHLEFRRRKEVTALELQLENAQRARQQALHDAETSEDRVRVLEHEWAQTRAELSASAAEVTELHRALEVQRAKTSKVRRSTIHTT